MMDSCEIKRCARNWSHPKSSTHDPSFWNKVRDRHVDLRDTVKMNRPQIKAIFCALREQVYVWWTCSAFVSIDT